MRFTKSRMARQALWRTVLGLGAVLLLSGLALALGRPAFAQSPSLDTVAPVQDQMTAHSMGQSDYPGGDEDTVRPQVEDSVKLPLIGEVDVSSMPLYLMTAIIAFVDGFNPCSLWLISLLLGIVVSTGSRRKVFLVGLTFLAVTMALYGVFMVGLLNVFRFVPYMRWIQVAVALLAFTFAVVNLKDYFWFKRGFSFTIPDRFKPGIFRDIRGIMNVESSTWAMVWATAVMALGVVVELPCTAGFPMVWTSTVAQHDVGAIAFGALLALYLVIYLLDELVVVAGATVAMRSSRFEERHGRALKLVGGMIMLALGVVMLVRWETMSEIGGILLVFGVAVVASLLVMLIHHRLSPVSAAGHATRKR